MLYLEDYLEMIEHLPQELRDRFTEMRELDLAVQNNMDSLDKKSRMFFQQCKRGELQHESMDTEFHSLRREYFKVMEDADEKVAIATQIHELVERYLRRLDSELFKFKCELEADNNGITEILEKRSLELDGNSTAATALLLSMNQKENRYYGASTANSLGVAVNVVGGGGGGGGGQSVAPIITSASSIGPAAVISGNGGGGSSAVSSVGINTLNSLPSAPLPVLNAAGAHQRHRKLEKRRETICTLPVQEKRANLNHSLPVAALSNATGGVGVAGVSGIAPSGPTTTTTNHVVHSSVHSSPHVTLPVLPTSNSTAVAAATIVRQLPTNLTAHSVLQTSAAAAAAAVVASNAAAVAAVVAPPLAATQHQHSGATAATVSYSLQQLSSGTAASSAIAAAASQAIVATQQMQQGRRTASLKASFEAIHGAGGNEFWSAANMAAAAQQSALQATPPSGPLPVAPSVSSAGHAHGHSHGHHHHQHQHQEKKQKKKFNSSISMPGGSSSVQLLGGSSSGNSITSSSSSMSVDSVDMLSNASSTAISNLSHASLTLNPLTPGGVATTPLLTAPAVHVSSAVGGGVTASAMGLPSTALAPGANLTIGENGIVVEQSNEGEWSYDPNEPRYCTCNQVSYGDMVACDNDACPYEWFHYPCVGITQPPKGKWYCPKCTASMRRRGNRKN